MGLNKTTGSVLLVLVALAVLAFMYGFVSLDKFSVSTPFLTFEFTSPNNLALPVLAIMLLLGLLIYHVVTHRYEVLYEYREGYRRAPKLVEEARALVVEASGGIPNNPTVGNIHATLGRAAWDLGQWTRRDQTLSPPVKFTPSPKAHRQAVARGLAHAFGPKLLWSFYAPVLLALCALVSMLS